MILGPSANWTGIPKLVPRIGVLVLLLSIVAFVTSLVLPPDHPFRKDEATVGAPLYARIALISAALFNFTGAFAHWILPDAGLEGIAGFDMGPHSRARTAAA